MSKRTLLTILAAGYLSFGCICNPEPAYWIYDRIDLSWYDYESVDRTVDTLTADTLYLIFKGEVDFLVQQSFFSSTSSNGLYALSCPSPGEAGPKYRFTRAELTANRSYQGVTAGSSLNDRVRFGPANYAGQPVFDSQTIAVDSLTIQLNETYWPYGPDGVFFILPKPTEEPGSYSFQLTIEDETGRSWETNSRPVFWR